MRENKPASSQSALWFERRTEERTEVLIAGFQRLVTERIPPGQRFEERNIAEVTEQRPVAGEHHLLRVVTPESASVHLSTEKHLGPRQKRTQRHPKIQRESTAPIERLPSDKAYEVGSCSKKLETSRQHAIELVPPISARPGRSFDAVKPVDYLLLEHLLIQGLFRGKVM